MGNRITAFSKDIHPITDIDLESCQYPDIILTREKKLVACWQRYLNKKDDIVACELTGENGKENELIISGSGQSFVPKLCLFKDDVWVIWSEFINNKCKLLMRTYPPKNTDDIIEIDESTGVFFPSVASDDHKIYISWTRHEDGVSKIFLAEYNGKSVSQKKEISSGTQNYRSSIVIVNDILYFAYDNFDDDQYNIKANTFYNGKVGGEIRISLNDNWACSPELAITSRGITAVWYDIAPASNITYWSSELFLQDGILRTTNTQKITSINNWFASLSINSNKENDILVHSWGQRNLIARYRIKDSDNWSTPILLTGENTNTSTIRPRIIINGDLFYFLYQFSNENGHKERFSSINLLKIDFDTLTKQDDSYMDDEVNTFTKPITAKKNLDYVEQQEKSEWLKKNSYYGLDVIFGDIHGQSDMSDGSGPVDMYYNFAKSKAKLDFTALTDHDIYPDVITESEWEYVRTLCNEFNMKHDFATLLSYEWTPNELRYDFGHKNVYFPTENGEIFRSNEPEGLTPGVLFNNVKKYNGIVIPHHPSATWDMVSAATDWDFHDPQVQRLVEIFSRHAHFEKDDSYSIYTKNNPRLKGKNVQDALELGYKLGFTAGSDSHQLEHGIEGGIVAAYVPELNRSYLFSALYNRFVYATSGARILVSLRVNGARMGCEVWINKNDSVTIEIDILGTANIAKVDLVKNNIDVFSPEFSRRKCSSTYIDKNLMVDSFYYIRVTQEDEHQAWSSPIWVGVT